MKVYDPSDDEPTRVIRHPLQVGRLSSNGVVSQDLEINEDGKIKVNLPNKETRLIFASPETCISGYLRPILNKFSREGWFQNLVVDEAHLIETWGAEFRISFQLLSATQKKSLCRRQASLYI